MKHVDILLAHPELDPRCVRHGQGGHVTNCSCPRVKVDSNMKDDYTELGAIKNRTVSLIRRDGVARIGLVERCGSEPLDTDHLLSATDARELAMLLLDGADQLDPVKRPGVATAAEQEFWDRAFHARAAVVFHDSAACALFADQALLQRRLSSSKHE